MTQVLPNPLPEPSRRKRFVRSPQAVLSMTPLRRELLRYVGEFGLLSLPQVARLAALPEKSTRRVMRLLFDAGLVDILPTSRAALADTDVVRSSELLFGSAPSIYTPSAAGRKLIVDLALLDEVHPVPQIGTLQLWLRHELLVREAQIWLTLTARLQRDYRLERWVDGKAAELAFPGFPRLLRPDAWFVFRLGQPVLVCMLEVDLGTEGVVRWQQKSHAYTALFRSGKLADLLGFKRARVLVIVPSDKRRAYLANLLQRLLPPDLYSRFWLANRSVLDTAGFNAAVWHLPGSFDVRPLVEQPPEQ